MTLDRIDALAEELFAAAREERPDRELGARVERATLANADATARRGERPSAQRGRRGPLLWRGLLAAIVCGGFAALVLLTRTRDAVIISAERAPDGVAAKPSTPPSAEHVTGDERARHEAASPRQALPGAAEPSESHRPLPEPPAAPAVEARVSPTEGATRSPAASTARRDGPRREATPPTPDDDGAAAPTSTPTLSKELGAIKQIRQALRNRDGSAALALLERYDSGEYGASLSLEASVLRVEALDAVGRRAEAEALARRFVRDNPDSPLAERAQRFLDRTDPARPATNPQP